MLDRTLTEVRKRIARQPNGQNENNTKATLLEPVLQALGWDVGDVEEVAREYRVKTRDKPVDYALLVLREPKLFVEAKGLGENLDDRRWSNQIMGYAAVAGVEWIVLTDGNEYRIYNSHASVPIEQKLLLKLRVSDESSTAVDVLGLLAKDQIQTKRIDALWRAHFVDRQVRSALDRLFNPDDMVLMNHISRFTKELSTEEIRGSLRRCKVTLDFPILPKDLAVTGRRSKTRTGSGGAAGGKRQPPTSVDVTLQDIIAAGLLTPPVALSRRYKGADLKARILRNGTVECLGKRLNSLSQAGSEARATVTGLQADGSLRATNGWTFWRYKKAAGQFAFVDEARQEFLRRRAGGLGQAATGA